MQAINSNKKSIWAWQMGVYTPPAKIEKQVGAYGAMYRVENVVFPSRKGRFNMAWLQPFHKHPDRRWYWDDTYIEEDKDSDQK